MCPQIGQCDWRWTCTNGLAAPAEVSGTPSVYIGPRNCELIHILQSYCLIHTNKISCITTDAGNALCCYTRILGATVEFPSVRWISFPEIRINVRHETWVPCAECARYFQEGCSSLHRFHLMSLQWALGVSVSPPPPNTNSSSTEYIQRLPYSGSCNVFGNICRLR
jgi:hypothetical protein